MQAKTAFYAVIRARLDAQTANLAQAASWTGLLTVSAQRQPLAPPIVNLSPGYRVSHAELVKPDLVVMIHCSLSCCEM